MRKPFLTDRLVLRDILESDAELLFELDSDPEVMRFIGPRPADDVSWYRQRIEAVYVPQQAHAWHGVWMVHDRASRQALGWVFVRPAPRSIVAREMGWTRPDEIEIGYRFRQPAWGRGIATEAATPLAQIALADEATTALVACAFKGNAASLRVLEKLGLERMGEVALAGASEPAVKPDRARASGSQVHVKSCKNA
jgi:RimJ/RimL family protein N-acetyltransferase